ncbi:MAG: DUF1080 domain-containing protein [Verrucomicrobiales bacterium]
MKRKTFNFVLTSFLCAPALFAAPGKGGTDIDPANVDADYAIQGEYTGTVDGEKAGGQVIALGDGKFEAVSYPGGLPGDGWDGDKKNRIKGKGETKDGAAILTMANGSEGVLKDGVITISDDGKETGELKRVVRKSPTLGAKAPEGAVILFDGKKHGADLWKGGRMSEDGLLMQGCTSKQTFSDFKIHIEFRTPYTPKARGQGRGNSGFYAHGRYEVQVLDSFGLEGNHNECGGIYSTKDPAVNMCFPPLTWQTYDIDFTAAKFEDGKKVANATMTVRHNGVLIHDKTVCDHATTASPMREGPQPGPVFFQNHGSPVRYRNIWVVPK